MFFNGHPLMPMELTTPDCITSFGADIPTLRGKMYVHPSKPGHHVVELLLRSYHYYGAKTFGKWIVVHDDWANVIPLSAHWTVLFQVMPDYTVRVTHINVPTTSEWFQLLDEPPA